MFINTRTKTINKKSVDAGLSLNELQVERPTRQTLVRITFKLSIIF